MKAFVITVLVVFAFDVISKVVILAGQKTQRDLATITYALVMSVAILMWGCWVLGGGAK